MTETTSREIDAALWQLRAWYQLGLKPEGYAYGFGREFLAGLLGINYNGEVESGNNFRLKYNRTGSDIIRQINGLHGWVMLQILIARAKEDENGRAA